MKKICFRELEWHLFYGIESGIPLCCVSFFLLKDIIRGLINLSDSTGVWNDIVHTFDQWRAKIEWGYSPCPICLIKGKKTECNLKEPPFGHPNKVFRLKHLRYREGLKEYRKKLDYDCAQN